MDGCAPSTNNKVSLFETVNFFHFFYLLIYLNKEFNVLMTIIPIAMCFLFISYCQLRNLYKPTLQYSKVCLNLQYPPLQQLQLEVLLTRYQNIYPDC